VEFSILGPVEVVVGSERLEVGGTRQQVAMAMLLLGANRLVTVERLLEAIYGDDLPPTGRSQVQIGISSLRRLFAAHGYTDVIVTKPGGYTLRVEESQLDAAQFERLVAEARATADPVEAVVKYRDALRLWRGPALSGIDRHQIRVAAGRLDELRVSVIEDRVARELDLGRHDEVVGELAELVMEHPLRERFHGQLMRALHNSGRTAEALQAFQRARRVLVSELGLEPSPELRRLHEAILRSDPVLDPSADPARPAPAALRTPRQLPSDIADFTGRDEQLSEIRRHLVRATSAPAAVPLVVLTGQAGAGKTALAVHCSHVLAEHFPDGQLFLDLHGGSSRPVSPAEALERFIRALGVPSLEIPESLDERAEAYRDLLADRKVLITLDDVFDEVQVTPLIPGNGATGVVLTSRGRLAALPGAGHVETGMLDADQSLELLGRIAGSARLAPHVRAAAAVAEYCGYLPLALRVAGSLLSAHLEWDFGQLADRLADEDRRLDELSHPNLDVRRRISRVYQSVGPQARQLLRWLALLDQPAFPGWVAAPLLGSGSPDTENTLAELVYARLIEVAGTGNGVASSYRFHPLTRVFARERVGQEEAETARRAALERMLGALLHLVRTAAHCLGHTDRSGDADGADRWLPEGVADKVADDPLAWFDRERAALVAGIRQAAEAELVSLGQSLARSAEPLFRARGAHGAWRDVVGTGLTADRPSVGRARPGRRAVAAAPRVLRPSAI
jgi:DNA-binding SARP family transcriptional activator